MKKRKTKKVLGARARFSRLYRLMINNAASCSACIPTAYFVPRSAFLLTKCSFLSRACFYRLPHHHQPVRNQKHEHKLLSSPSCHCLNFQLNEPVHTLKLLGKILIKLPLAETPRIVFSYHIDSRKLLMRLYCKNQKFLFCFASPHPQPLPSF